MTHPYTSSLSSLQSQPILEGLYRDIVSSYDTTLSWNGVTEGGQETY